MSSAATGTVTIDNVTFRYPTATLPALAEETWSIAEGSFALVVGRSGSGKSTLLRAINGLVPHFSGGAFGGSVRVGEMDTRRHGPRDLGSMVGFVFQDPESQLVTDQVDREIAFGLEQRGIDRPTMRRRVEEVLDLLGIAHLRRRNPLDLSGGERQRVAIAATLALQPRILVLDEPTSQLDPWGASDVVHALAQLNDDLGLTIVVAEHRLEQFLPRADVLRWMPGTPELSLTGPVRDVLPRLDPIQLPPVTQLGELLEVTPVPLTVREARRGALAGMLPAGAVPPTDVARAPGDVVGRLDGITVKAGHHDILRNLSLRVGEGELVAVMGRNGSGKTTLLRTMAGLQRVEEGKVETLGMDMSRHHPADLDGKVGYLPQQATTMFFRERLVDELSDKGRNEDKAIRELMNRFGLTEHADSHPLDLSGGERERAALASVLARTPRMLLLDEPTRGMDAWRKAALAGHLQSLAAAGMAVVLVTHDIELVARCATRVVMLADGQVLTDEPTRQALTGSLTWSTQINKVFGGQWMTVDDVITSTEGPLPVEPDLD